MSAFSENLLQIAADRALGKETVDLDPVAEELLNIYMHDPNSSTLREEITIRVAGCKSLPGKLGRDCIHEETGVEKEVKPKNYTNKPTNGGGCFNDYTRSRWKKDSEVNLPMIQSLFVDGKLQYVVEYDFDAIKDRLDEQVTKICEEEGNRYVRSASWTYKHWIDHPSLKVHYLNLSELAENQGTICKPFLQKLIKK